MTNNLYSLIHFTLVDEKPNVSKKCCQRPGVTLALSVLMYVYICVCIRVCIRVKIHMCIFTYNTYNTFQSCPNICST